MAVDDAAGGEDSSGALDSPSDVPVVPFLESDSFSELFVVDCEDSPGDAPGDLPGDRFDVLFLLLVLDVDSPGEMPLVIFSFETEEVTLSEDDSPGELSFF